jgi:hypothetical protein
MSKLATILGLASVLNSGINMATEGKYPEMPLAFLGHTETLRRFLKLGAKND